MDVRRRGTVVIEHVHGDAYAAIDCAMGRLKRTVRRRINRVRDQQRSQQRQANQMRDIAMPDVLDAGWQAS